MSDLRTTLPEDVGYRMMRVNDDPELVRFVYLMLAAAPDAQELLTPLEAVGQLSETIEQNAKKLTSVSLSQMICLGERWLRAIYDDSEFVESAVKLWWEKFPECKAHAADVQEDGVPR